MGITSWLNSSLEQAQATITEQAAEIAKLRTALQPFADKADYARRVMAEHKLSENARSGPVSLKHFIAAEVALSD